MCGGRGTRLDVALEKPLVPVCGAPMVDGVLGGLATSGIDRVWAAVSPHTPETARYLAEHPLSPSIVETPGRGYVADLRVALDRVGTPVVTVTADLPFVAADHIKAARQRVTGIERQTSPSVTVCVPASLKRHLGTSIETTINHENRAVVPTGLNVVASGDRDVLTVLTDPRLAVNVNRPGDRQVAEELCD